MAKSGTGAPDLVTQVLQFGTGYWVSRLVYTVAEFGVADHLKKGGLAIEKLAKATKTKPEMLYRVMRACASLGLFRETKGRVFSCTKMGAILRADHPQSLKSFMLMIADDYNCRAWQKLSHGVATGSVPFQTEFGMPVFAWMEGQPEKARIFGESMTSISNRECPAVAAAFDFSKFKTIVDVGGSQGALLAAILKKTPKLIGTLFDQPSVIDRAVKGPFVADKKLKGRLGVARGSFFDAVPKGADAYIMKYILHDWNDDECVRILENCKNAMSRGGRVLVVDNVILPGNAPSWGKMLDINMLCLTTGRERTKEEFATILRRAGLQLVKVHATAGPLCIVESKSAASVRRPR